MPKKNRDPERDRGIARSTKRLGYYTMIMPDILAKYKGYEIHIAGHGNGALNLLELFRQGTLNPEQMASSYLVNVPSSRDREWMNDVDSFVRRAPNSLWFL